MANYLACQVTVLVLLYFCLPAYIHVFSVQRELIKSVLVQPIHLAQCRSTYALPNNDLRSLTYNELHSQFNVCENKSETN